MNSRKFLCKFGPWNAKSTKNCLNKSQSIYKVKFNNTIMSKFNININESFLRWNQRHIISLIIYMRHV